MFLALSDAGRDKDLETIAQILLGIAAKFIPETPQGLAAARYWSEGLTDPTSNKPDKELADRVYLVIRSVADGLDAHDGPWKPRTGDMVIAERIRKIVPVAPGGFRKLGKREGTGLDAGVSSRSIPNRTILSFFGRGAPEIVGEAL